MDCETTHKLAALKQAYEADLGILLTKWQRFPSDPDDEMEMNEDFKRLDQHYKERKRELEERNQCDYVVKYQDYERIRNLYNRLLLDCKKHQEEKQKMFNLMNNKLLQQAKRTDTLMRSLNVQYKKMHNWQSLYKSLKAESTTGIQKDDMIKKLTNELETANSIILNLQEENMSLKASGALCNFHLSSSV